MENLLENHEGNNANTLLYAVADVTCENIIKGNKYKLLNKFETDEFANGVCYVIIDESKKATCYSISRFKQ